MACQMGSGATEQVVSDTMNAGLRADQRHPAAAGGLAAKRGGRSHQGRGCAPTPRPHVAPAPEGDSLGCGRVNRIRPFPSPCKPLRGITKKASPLVNTGTFAKNRLFWLLFENAPESSVYQRVKI